MIALLFAIALTAGPTQTHAQLDKAEVDIKPVVMTTEDAAPVLAGVAVTVECTARSDGNVEGCIVLGETHPGLGFGEAAVALVQDSHVEPGQGDIQFARTIQFTP